VKRQVSGGRISQKPAAVKFGTKNDAGESYEPEKPPGKTVDRERSSSGSKTRIPADSVKM